MFATATATKITFNVVRGRKASPGHRAFEAAIRDFLTYCKPDSQRGAPLQQTQLRF